MSSPNIEKTLIFKQTYVYKDLKGPHFNPNWHFHPEFQLSYIAEGKGTRFIGDHLQDFKEGDLVLTGPNLPHLWRSDDAYFQKDSTLTTRGLVVYFDRLLFNELLLEKEEFYDVYRLVENSTRGIHFYGDITEKVRDNLLCIPDERGFRKIIRLLEIIDLLAASQDYKLLASPGYCNFFKDDDADKMRQVYDYVMSHFRTKISLSEIASLLNMTPTSFCRYFKPRANKTFIQFVNEIRIGHARKLLVEDNLNINQISYECGFNTLSNFNRQFKQMVEMSPQEYRRIFLNIKSSLS